MKDNKNKRNGSGFLGDYWRANRQAERENEEARRREGNKDSKKWKTSELTMLVIIIAAAVALVFKYVIFKNV